MQYVCRKNNLFCGKLFWQIIKKAKVTECLPQHVSFFSGVPPALIRLTPKSHNTHSQSLFKIDSSDNKSSSFVDLGGPLGAILCRLYALSSKVTPPQCSLAGHIFCCPREWPKRFDDPDYNMIPVTGRKVRFTSLAKRVTSSIITIKRLAKVDSLTI